MKTVQDLINQNRERQNPKYLEIKVKKNFKQDGYESFYDVSNIKEDGEMLEFDGKNVHSDTFMIHVKVDGRIVEFREKLV